MGRSSPLAPFLRKLAPLGVLALASLVLAGCDMNGHQSTMHVEGPVARMQLHLFYITLGVTTFIFLTVGSALAYAQIKFRARKGDEGKDPPPQTHGHPLVEMGLIAASTLLLVIIAIPTVRGIIYQEDTADPENAMQVKVTGYQWWFKFEYPELGITTANELVIPTNRPVHVELRTMDVIHSFWVPKLAGKKDLVPNRANHMWLQADKADYYWAQCAEFCGESHANMKFRVIALDPAAFAEWQQRESANARTVDAQTASAEALRPRVQFAAYEPPGQDDMASAASPFAYWQEKQLIPEPGSENADLIHQGRDLFASKTCAGCHTIRGHKASNGMPFMGITGPDLTHFGSRTTIAAAVMDNTRDNLRAWLTDPNAIKPGNIMWKTGGIGNTIKLTDDEKDALIAYLESLK